MTEILSPCGSIESLAAALNTGADAVYIGLKKFSARKNAENFSAQTLKEACDECHRRGVKLYAALNTMVYDSEAEELAQAVKTAAECGADGFIMQDLGAIGIAREVCPEMPIHASTQMSLNSAAGVRAAQQSGFSRVVLGRELSFEEIKRIAKSTSLPLEIFVHGALCTCISGQCYMSSVFGGRSGNRGLCAQPCRLDFSVDQRHSVLSLKDSSLIPHLKEFEALGIASIKIEGRMKRPEYVACATDACKKSLLGEQYDEQRLNGIFSRGGLTDGYFTGKLDNMQGTRGKEDVLNSAKALNGIKALYKDEFARFRVDIDIDISAGEPISVCVKCGGIYVSAEGEVPQAAINAPTTEESVIARFSKLGGTQFYAGEISATVGESLMVPVSALNALRRELCSELDRRILENNTPKYVLHDLQDLKPFPERNRENLPAFRAEIANENQLMQAVNLPFEMIYAPMNLLSPETQNKEKIAVLPPFYLADDEEKIVQKLKMLRECGFSHAVAQTLGHAQLLKELGFTVHGGYRLNIINSRAARFYDDFGLCDSLLSFEGTAAQLSEISCAMPRGILAYGRLPLMLLRRCPIADGKPCGGAPCGKGIIDRRGSFMPILCGGSSVEVLNPDTLIMSDRADTLGKFDFALLKFTTETELKPIYDMYLSGRKPSGALTRGLYFRGAE